MNNDKRHQILNRFKNDNPNPVIELVYHSPFELLLAVLLSSQSKDDQVNKVTRNLFLVANTPQTVLALGIVRIIDLIKSIGLYNIKAKNIVNTSQLLVEKHHGLIPENRLSLEKLPGIGRKSANVLLNVIFGWPVIAVDTHVFRFCNRSRFAVGNTVQKVESKLMKVVPSAFKLKCHHWFVLHGRYICRARKPLCHVCCINDLCEFIGKIYFFNILYFLL